MELMIFVLLACALAVLAQSFGEDTRDLVRPAEATGSRTPLTV